MLKSNYKSIHQYGEEEFDEKKSRFIGYAKPVKNEEEAIEFINQIKEIHKTATHNCSAYIINQNLKRFDDDGEPSHTAGMPMLSVLEKEGLEEVVGVVTRYFGGTLLGKGGLVRAYTQGIQVALDKAIIVDKIRHLELDLIVDYSFLGQINNYVNLNNVLVLDRFYTEKVSLKIYLDELRLGKFKEDMMNITSADMEIKTLGSKFLSVKHDKIIL